MPKRRQIYARSHFGLFGASCLLLALTLFALSPAQSSAAPKRPAGYFPDPSTLSPSDFLPAGNHGKPGDRFLSRTGVFKVKLVGYQMTRWSLHSPPDGICSGTATGGGFERVVFRAPVKRMRLSAFGQRRLTSMVLPRLITRGQLTRKGTYKYTPAPDRSPDCPEGDGIAQDPPPPDCGTRKFSGIPMSLAALDGFFSLKSHGETQHRPHFRNCARPPVVWPTMIEKKTNGKEIRTRFPANLFFNPKFDPKKKKWRKVIVIARGTEKRRTFTSSRQTSLEWTLTVTRLR